MPFTSRPHSVRDWLALEDSYSPDYESVFRLMQAGSCGGLFCLFSLFSFLFLTGFLIVLRH